MSGEVGPVAGVTACAALVALTAVFAPGPPLPGSPPAGLSVDVPPIVTATPSATPTPAAPTAPPAAQPPLGLAAGGPAAAPPTTSSAPPPSGWFLGWGGRLGTDPAAAFAEIRAARSVFGPATQAPACGALHRLPPYAPHLRDFTPAPSTVAFAARFLSLLPMPSGLTPKDRGELDLLTHLAVDLLFEAGSARARTAMVRLSELEAPEDDGQDEFEHDCLAWQITRARIANDLLARRPPAEQVRVRPRLVRWLLQHVGPRGRIGAGWTHGPRWPCRTRAEEDGASAEQVTALSCLALLHELPPQRARDLLAPTVRWLCAALPRVRTHEHPTEGCLDDLCRCERLGSETGWAIRAALARAQRVGIEAARVRAVLKAEPDYPSSPGARPDPLTSPLRVLAARAIDRKATTPRAWGWSVAQRLHRVWEEAAEDETEACVDAIGQEAPALEAASWLLALRGLELWFAEGGAPLPAPAFAETAAPRVHLIAPGATPSVRSRLIRELTAAGWRVVTTPGSERTVTLRAGKLDVTGGKAPVVVPLFERDAKALRKALDAP